MVTNSRKPVVGTSARRTKWAGAIAGASASLVALTVVVVLREVTGIVSILDALEQVILDWTPIGLFSTLIDIFGTAAKAWLFIGIIAMLLFLGTSAGWLFASHLDDSRRPIWRTALSFAVVALAVLSLFMIWAVYLRVGDVTTYLTLAKVLSCVVVVALTFGLGLSLALAWVHSFSTADSADSPPIDQSKRRLLSNAGVGVAGLASLVVLGREVNHVRSSETVVASGGAMPAPITPNDAFYIVSKNFIDPRVNTSDRNWTIRVDGMVRTARSFSATDLQSLAEPDFVSTLTCISNPIGGPLISTAKWTGASLARILNLCGLEPEASTVVFHGSDGYTDSLPLAKATAPTTMLVWAMNGQPLPRRHGFPVRVIVPGRYGIKNVKWLERVEVTRGEYQGYWQQKGWTNAGVVKTESQIRVPGDKAIVHTDRADLAGLAFAGDRGVRTVEVSLDGGDTWQTTTIVANPSAQNLSWVFWRLPWRPAPGTYTLLVRATDGTGALQTSAHAAPLPDGASGWQRIVVGVVG